MDGGVHETVASISRRHCPSESGCTRILCWLLTMIGSDTGCSTLFGKSIGVRGCRRDPASDQIAWPWGVSRAAKARRNAIAMLAGSGKFRRLQLDIIPKSQRAHTRQSRRRRCALEGYFGGCI
jgi:hypothetical protein